jgi:hypothetical protein
MVLIITEEADYSTNIVINWLSSFGIKWVRLNENNQLSIDFYGDDFKMISVDESFYFSDLKCVWYRRGLLNIKFKEVDGLKKLHILKN